MYCGNKFFASSSFIFWLNVGNEEFPGNVVAITSLQDLEGPEYNASVRVPMKCKATFTFADHHKETGVMKVNILYGASPQFGMEIFLGQKLDMHWSSAEKIAERQQQIIEKKKELIELHKKIDKTMLCPLYKCIYLSVDSEGYLNHATSIVSHPDICGNNPYDEYYPELRPLIREKVNL